MVGLLFAILALPFCVNPSGLARNQAYHFSASAVLPDASSDGRVSNLNSVVRAIFGVDAANNFH